ncbi:cyclin-like protein interacting with PHO85 [Basidiobolus ranarum]|uniref:Cyclin-like protein interacting with PHO85 n=1 Tax=Basidiobolus ranarum TaxID=34480 RepID=A0ABR2W043_9FUNG
MNSIAKFPVANMRRLVARYLEAELVRNELYEDLNVTPFHSSIVPCISIESYIRRIQKSISLESHSLVVSLIYLDRATQSTNHVYVNEYTIHRLLIASITIANKFLNDECYPNSLYAKIGGLPSHELNSLELELLFMIDFELNIQPQEFLEYTHRLMSYGVEDLIRGTSCTRARQRLSLSGGRCIETPPCHSDRRNQHGARLDGSSELDKLVFQVNRTILSRETTCVNTKDSEVLRSAKDRLRALLSNRNSNSKRASVCSNTPDYPTKPIQTRPASYHPSTINSWTSMVSVPM